MAYQRYIKGMAEVYHIPTKAVSKPYQRRIKGISKVCQSYGIRMESVEVYGKGNRVNTNHRSWQFIFVVLAFIAILLKRL